MAKRYWANRTARDTEDHRSLIGAELSTRGLLRQGWGDIQSQNLRTITKLWLESAWEATSEEQRNAWHQWRMLLDDAPYPVRHDSMNLGEITSTSSENRERQSG